MTVAADGLISLAFVDGNDGHIPPLLGYCFILPDICDEKVKFTDADVASLFKDLHRNTVQARGLVVLQ